jgi:hypothetical protein
MLENIGTSMKWLSDNGHHVNRFLTDFGNLLFENVAKNLETASYWIDQYILGLRSLNAIKSLDFESLQSIADESRARDKAFLKSVKIYEDHTKASYLKSYEEWTKIETKKKADIKANAEKAIKEAKKIEAALGFKPADAINANNNSNSGSGARLAGAAEVGSVAAFSLKYQNESSKNEKAIVKWTKQTAENVANNSLIINQVAFA